MTRKITHVTTRTNANKDNAHSELSDCLLSRRQFLWAGALSVTATTVSMSFGSALANTLVPAQEARYPHLALMNFDDLKVDEPYYFNYPDERQNSNCMLVKLGTQAGGGIGPQQDIVAFSVLCTHQGMPLIGAYQAQEKALGACPAHLSTYDLTRHGIIISGQAYQSLPQVLLEHKDNEIYAVGLRGLIFGRNQNLLHDPLNIKLGVENA